MKLCFSTLGCVDYPLERSLALAQDRGLSVIEIRGASGKIQNSEIPEFKDPAAAKDLFARYGVHPWVIGTSCSFHNAGDHAAALAEGRHAVDLAADLICPYIRVFGNENKAPDATANLIDGLKFLCDYSITKYVTILLEVHGDFNTAEALSPVLSAMSDSPAFGLIWDIAHTDRGYRENWREFYEFARPFIKHIHVKDHIRVPEAGKDPLRLPGNGEIPITDITSALIADGYTGFFSLEWERAWHPDLPPIEDALDAYFKILG